MSWCIWTKPSLSAALVCRVLCRSLASLPLHQYAASLWLGMTNNRWPGAKKDFFKGKKERKKKEKKAGRRKEGTQKSIEMEGDRTDLGFVSLY